MFSFASALVLLLASSSVAAPVPAPASTQAPTPTLPFNTASPGATPAYYQVPLPSLLPQSTHIKYIGATAGSVNFEKLAAKTVTTGAGPAINCLDGSYNDLDINSLFNAGGAGTTVFLCPSTTLLLLNPIQLSAQRQTLTTLGMPTGSTRATIQVTGSSQTAAVIASCTDCSYSAIRNIQIDGNRPVLGQWSMFQSALIEIGGNALHQVVDSVRAFG